METLSSLPEVKRAFVTRLVPPLSQVPGLVALALGGSYAAGTQHASSDLDVALYYREAQPLDLKHVAQIANEVAVERPPTVTGFYDWGPWVNGGAWIKTAAGKLDFLYRNLDQVERTISAAVQGHAFHDFGQQPTFGFYSVIYLAETQVCLPLFDPGAVLAGLKQRVQAYPPALRANVIQGSLWSAEFTLVHARAHAAAGDVYNTVGCLTRVAANLTQALFALNERYFLSDKRVLQVLGAFSRLPPGYVNRLNAVLAAPGQAPDQLQRSVEEMAGLWAAVVRLVRPPYTPSFPGQTRPEAPEIEP